MGSIVTEKKGVVEDYIQLRMADLRKFGWLLTDKSGSLNWTHPNSEQNKIWASIKTVDEFKTIRLVYTFSTIFSEQKARMDYHILLTPTQCHYGGVRYWFSCPLCQNRVAVLYGSKWFACRQCLDLSYQSRQEGKAFKVFPLSLIDNQLKLEKLYDRMKRAYYAGKPTKLYQRILDLEQQSTLAVQSLGLG